MSKSIRSHRERVKEANRLRKLMPEDISIVDREAIVEWLLLVDIANLYKAKLKSNSLQENTTEGGKLAQKKNVEKFKGIINIFETSAEIAQELIKAGNYKAVWKAIPEHALLTAAKSVAYLDTLAEIALDLLKKISDDAFDSKIIDDTMQENIKKMENHYKNLETVSGLSEADVKQTIEDAFKAVQVAIPSSNTDSTPTPNLK